MTLRLTIGVDPGASGALAILRDGCLFDAVDMPTMPRQPGGEQVDPARLGSLLRGWRGMHPGAHVLAVLEKVGARPGNGGSSMFAFGDSYGCARCAMGVLGIPLVHAPPAVWKRALGLAGAAKDVARTRAIETWPMSAELFRRKKDVGRADAALIALWGWKTGRHAEAA